MWRLRHASLALAVAAAAGMLHPFLPVTTEFAAFYVSLFVCALVLALAPEAGMRGLYGLSALRWGANVAGFGAIACGFLFVLSLLLPSFAALAVRRPPTGLEFAAHLLLSAVATGALGVLYRHLSKLVMDNVATAALAVPRGWRRLPITGPVAGVLFGVMLIFAMQQTYLSGRAARALEMARQEAPGGREFFLEELNIHRAGGGREVTAVVSFDDAGSRRRVTLRWREAPAD